MSTVGGGGYNATPNCIFLSRKRRKKKGEAPPNPPLLHTPYSVCYVFPLANHLGSALSAPSPPYKALCGRGSLLFRLEGNMYVTNKLIAFLSDDKRYVYIYKKEKKKSRLLLLLHHSSLFIYAVSNRSFRRDEPGAILQSGGMS